VARSEVVASGLKIAGRRVREGDARQAHSGEFHSDHANPTADVKKVEALNWRAAQFCQEHSRAGIGTMVLTAAQITLRLHGIEVDGCSRKGPCNKPWSKPQRRRWMQGC